MYNLAHRILKKLDPELSHNISIKALKLGIYPKIICKNTEEYLSAIITVVFDSISLLYKID